MNETASTTLLTELSTLFGRCMAISSYSKNMTADKDTQVPCSKACLQDSFLDSKEMRCSVADSALHKISAQISTGNRM